MRLGLALLAPLLAAELSAARPGHVLSSNSRLTGVGSLDFSVALFAKPAKGVGKPPPLPAATKTTCKVLGICLLIGFFAPCLVCLEPNIRLGASVGVGIGSLAALIYVFLWDSGIMATWQAGGQLGGWCTVVVVAAVLQLFNCCCGALFFFLAGTAVAAEAAAQSADDIAKLDANRGEQQEFAPFVGTGHTLDDDDDGAGVGVDRA
jgi:hypothetical protein